MLGWLSVSSKCGKMMIIIYYKTTILKYLWFLWFKFYLHDCTFVFCLWLRVWHSWFPDSEKQWPVLHFKWTSCQMKWRSKSLTTCYYYIHVFSWESSLGIAKWWSVFIMNTCRFMATYDVFWLVVLTLGSLHLLHPLWLARMITVV